MYGYILLTVCVLGTVQTPDGAPVLPPMPADGDFIDPYLWQGVLKRILIEAIFNVTDNFYTIRNAFQPQPGVHKICIPVTYSIEYIYCTDQFDQDINNCTIDYEQSIIWTEFDTMDTAGNIVFKFASSGFSVFGFDWAGACDTDLDSGTSTLYLYLNATSLLSNDTDLAIHQYETDLLQTLLYITTLVRLSVNSNNLLPCNAMCIIIM